MKKVKFNKLWAIGVLVGSGFVLNRFWRQQNPVSLRDKVVIVTGASSGIGRVVARMFANHGALVVLVARRAGKLLELQQELAVHDTHTLVVPTDLSRDEDMVALVDKVMAEFGRIDVLVNNAGLATGGYFEELPPDEVKLMIDVNLYAPIRLTQLVVPIMREQQSGHIVNVSSMAGQLPAAGMTAYAATRRGLSAFTTALRRELGDSPIRVSLILPAWTTTEMTKHLNVNAMYASRGLLPMEKFDEADVPAMGVLDAVRYNRSLVRFGGFQFRSAYWLEPLVPWYMDLYWRYFIDTPGWIDALLGIGTE